MPLRLATYLDVSSARPDRDARINLAVEIEASGTPVEVERPPSRTVLVIDVSGSMGGEKLDQVIRSVDLLLDALRPIDEVGVVAFSDGATRVVDPVKVDAAGKRLVRSRVARLTASGKTNISGGIELGAEMMRGVEAGVRQGIVLLSDGAPNVGAIGSDALREAVRAYRPNISVFTLGYGADHCEDILVAIGESGGGGYELVVDPTTCARAFARALGAQGDVVASGIELAFVPAEGIEIVRFLSREETRFSREGIVVAVPDMVAHAKRVVAAEIAVKAPGPRFLADVVQVTARSRAPSSNELETVSASASLEVADRDPVIRSDGARRVLLVRTDQARDDARALADRAHFAAAAAKLRAVLSEIERIPDWVANDGSPLAEAYELLVDEAMAYERRPSAEVYAAFRQGTIGYRAAESRPQVAKERGLSSRKLMELTAGDLPPAWLVVLEGASIGERFKLEEELIIGRTADAQISIKSGSISRRQAEVFALEGDFWIADLGSTNSTYVNGKALLRAPQKLQQGDVVQVGTVKLRYVEGPRKK